MHSIYISNSLRQAWDKKTGNAADINMILGVLLLRELELDSDPVILVRAISEKYSSGKLPEQIQLCNCPCANW